MIINLFLGLSLGILVASFFICVFSINLLKVEHNNLIKLSQRKIFSSGVFVIFFLFAINIVFMIIGLLLSFIYIIFFNSFDSSLILSSNIYFSYFIIILNFVLFLPTIYIFYNFRISIFIFSLIFIIIFGWIMPFFIS